jgi:hypothetical protein
MRFFKFFVLILTFVSTKGFTQQAPSIQIGEVESSLNLPSGTVNILESKLVALLTKQGTSGRNSLAIYKVNTNLELLENNVIQGMKTLNAAKIITTFSFESRIDGTVLESISIETTGSGYSEEKAVKDAISNINTDWDEFGDVLESLLERSVVYLEGLCAQIEVKANTLSKTKEYEQAIALLMIVPPEAVDCYKSSNQLAIETYRLFAEDECNKLISKANASAALNNYSDAVYFLSKIDPTTGCFEQSKEILEQIESEVDKEEEYYKNLKEKYYADEIELEKIRLNNMLEISLAQSQSPLFSLNLESLFGF